MFSFIIIKRISEINHFSLRQSYDNVTLMVQRQNQIKYFLSSSISIFTFKKNKWFFVTSSLDHAGWESQPALSGRRRDNKAPIFISNWDRMVWANVENFLPISKMLFIKSVEVRLTYNLKVKPPITRTENIFTDNILKQLGQQRPKFIYSRYRLFSVRARSVVCLLKRRNLIRPS